MVEHFMPLTHLEDAILIATHAHRGKRDRSDAPYILHPLRVMLRMQTDEQRIVAVLHDVAEDTDVSLVELSNMPFCTNDILDALILLTHESNDPYEHYIDAIAKNRLATVVKLADLHDNMMASRFPGDPPPWWVKKLPRYRAAYEVLSRACRDGLLGG
jgi:(p)ppGpp synthase/HD superfamily hydrolase